VDEGIYLGYSLHGHVYRAYNRRTMLVEESMHIASDETNQNMQESTNIGVDDKVPTRQQVDTQLQNKPEKVSQLLENQSIKPRIQSIESEAGVETINYELPRE